MRKKSPVTLGSLLPLLGMMAALVSLVSARVYAEGTTRGIIIAAEHVEAASYAAFADALLHALSQQEATSATLLSLDAALWRAAGITEEEFNQIVSGPPDQASMPLLNLARRLYLVETIRVTLTNAEGGAQAQILWARPELGQVREITITLPQPLTRDTAPLLAGKVAPVLKRGWDQARTVASLGSPGPVETQPEVPPDPAPPLPSAPTSDEADEGASQDREAPSGLLATAREALQEGETGRALDLVAQALHAGEDQVAGLLLRAQIYAGQREVEKQKEALLSAIGLDESLYEPRLQLAAMERARGLWQEAARLYRGAIAAHPQYSAAYIQLYSLYWEQRQPQRALEALEEGAEAAPENLELLSALASEYQRRGLLASAEETYATIVARDEGEHRITALRALGRMYMQVGNFYAAFEAYRQAAQDAPGESQEHYRELFSACDRAVAQSLEQAFAALADLQSDSPEAPPREEVYQRIAAAVQKIRGLRDFTSQVQSPLTEELPYAQRMVYYALALEAATNALVYVDTGETSLKTAAEQRRQEAATMPAAWTEAVETGG